MLGVHLLKNSMLCANAVSLGSRVSVLDVTDGLRYTVRRQIRVEGFGALFQIPDVPDIVDQEPV